MTTARDIDVSGACLCGAIKVTGRVPDRTYGVCHCAMCRRWAGGPWAAVAATDVVFCDEGALGVVSTSPWAERLFCATCGSALAYRIKQTGETHVSLYALDDTDGFAMTMQVFIDDKPPHYAFTNQTKTMTGPELFALYSDPSEPQNA